MNSLLLEPTQIPDTLIAGIMAIVCSQKTCFAAEAIRRAENAGYFPAEGQREVDWEEVELWARRVQEPGFRWLSVHEQYGTGYIVLGANGAIASGQHRILGGLMGGNPVPESS